MAAKQEIIDEVFEKSINKLTELSKEQFLNFVKNSILSMNLTGKQTLILNETGLKFNRENKILNNINKESFVYYVHSFMATEMIDENLIAYSKYGDINIPGIVNKGNVYGMQFHPEKSGEVGLKILKNFGVLSKWL